LPFFAAAGDVTSVVHRAAPTRMVQGIRTIDMACINAPPDRGILEFRVGECNTARVVLRTLAAVLSFPSSVGRQAGADGAAGPRTGPEHTYVFEDRKRRPGKPAARIVAVGESKN